MIKSFLLTFIISFFFQFQLYSDFEYNCEYLFSNINKTFSSQTYVNTNAQERSFDKPGYFILTRSFGTRDIPAIEKSIPDLKRIGVKQLWISPLEPQTTELFINNNFPPSKNDHGYWPKEHGKIDPKLGGELAFKRLMKKAKEEGIEIMIDSVLDHFGYGDDFKINGKKVSYNDSNYFRNPDDKFNDVPIDLDKTIENSTDPTGIRELFKILTQYEMFSLPGLNHKNAEIQKYLLESYKRYIDMGVRSFRIDGAKHIPVEFLRKFMSDLSMNSPKKLTFLVESLFNKYPVLDVYMKDISKGFSSPKADIYFIDFPLANELRQLYTRADYKFGYLWSFLKYRESGERSLQNLVPMVEDHDLLEPLTDPFLKKTIHVLSEFLSLNSTIIYQGTESSVNTKNNSRQYVSKVNPSGDAAKIVKVMSETMEPYRKENTNNKTIERWIEDDFIVLEKDDGDGNFLLLFINKGNRPVHRIVDVYKNLDDKKIKIKVSENLNNSVIQKFKNGKLKINAPENSFAVFEVSVD